MGKLIGWLIVLALDIPTVMLRGFVLSRLWQWFIAPLGVAQIGIAQAIGISILVGLLAKDGKPKDDDEDTPALGKACVALLVATFASLVSWGLGAFIHGFM